MHQISDLPIQADTSPHVAGIVESGRHRKAVVHRYFRLMSAGLISIVGTSGAANRD